MPSGQLIKHWRTVRCFKNTDMQLRQRSVEVTKWCTNMELSLTEKEGGETIDGVEVFKYLGWVLEQSDNN